MSFFGHQQLHGVITAKLNFQTFVSSFLLLFRLTTAQGWEEILEGLSMKEPLCEKDDTCGNFVSIYIYFFLSTVYKVLHELISKD